MQPESPRQSRRRWLKRAVFAGLGSSAGLSVYAWRIEPHWLEFTFRDLPLVGLPKELEGIRVAHLSDLHIGPIVDSRYLIHSLRQLAELQPDFVCITGDITHGEGDPTLDDVARVMEHCPQARLGRFVALGNHDYTLGWQNADFADALSARLHSLGFQVLRNEKQMIGGLTIVGLDDYWAPNFAPKTALKDVLPDAPSLALCHNPDVADLDVWGNFRGWILAGHTHGGQCKPPFLPPPMLPVKNQRYSSGVFRLDAGRTMSISRGLGYLKRVRFNVRPEITLFRLLPG